MSHILWPKQWILSLLARHVKWWMGRRYRNGQTWRNRRVRQSQFVAHTASAWHTYILPTTATISYYCQPLLLATVAAADILPTSNHLSFSLSTRARWRNAKTKCKNPPRHVDEMEEYKNQNASTEWTPLIIFWTNVKLWGNICEGGGHGARREQVKGLIHKSEV